MIAKTPPHNWTYNASRLGYVNKQNNAFVPSTELAQATQEERDGFFKTGKFEYKPRKVVNVYCKCGELQLRMYPYASFNLPTEIPICKRCRNKSLK